MFRIQDRCRFCRILFIRDNKNSALMTYETNDGWYRPITLLPPTLHKAYIVFLKG